MGRFPFSKFGSSAARRSELFLNLLMWVGALGATVRSVLDEALALARVAGYTSFLRLSDRATVPLPSLPGPPPVRSAL